MALLYPELQQRNILHKFPSTPSDRAVCTGRDKEQDSMKRLFLTSSLALALTGTLALAQSTSTPPDTTQGYHRHHHAPNPQRVAQRMGERLGLSADQTAKLEPIFADSQQKMAALRADTSLSPEQRHQQFRTIHESVKTQLATVLTAQQMQELQQMRHGRGHGWGKQQGSTSTTPQPGS
jgi:periplasmic protein CpxP/Spy